MATEEKDDTSKRTRTTIAPEVLAYFDTFGKDIRDLESKVSNRLTRGEMSDLLTRRTPVRVELLAKQFRTTSHKINTVLDLIQRERLVRSAARPGE